jgi:hypothetical protein
MKLTAVLLGLFAVVGVAPADETVARPKMV